MIFLTDWQETWIFLVQLSDKVRDVIKSFEMIRKKIHRFLVN